MNGEGLERFLPFFLFLPKESVVSSTFFPFFTYADAIMVSVSTPPYRSARPRGADFYPSVIE